MISTDQLFSICWALQYLTCIVAVIQTVYSSFSILRSPYQDDSGYVLDEPPDSPSSDDEPPQAPSNIEGPPPCLSDSSLLKQEEI